MNIYMEFYPREEGISHNVVVYVETLVSSLRGCSMERNGFKPGKGTEIVPEEYVENVYKGLEKIASLEYIQYPLLQQNLLKVKEVMNLKGRIYKDFGRFGCIKV